MRLRQSVYSNLNYHRRRLLSTTALNTITTCTSQSQFIQAATAAPPFHDVFLSSSTDPYLNMALERYLLDTLPLHNDFGATTCQRMFIYVNDPCVLIGRSQNPWLHANLSLIYQNNLKEKVNIVRRHSGGRAVMNDAGTVNVALMNNTKNDFPGSLLQMVVNGVNSMPDQVLKRLSPSPETSIDDDPLGEVFGQPMASGPLDFQHNSLSTAGSDMFIQVPGPPFKLKLNGPHSIVKEDTEEEIASSACYLSSGSRRCEHASIFLDTKLDARKALLNTMVEDNLSHTDIDDMRKQLDAMCNLQLDKEVFVEMLIDQFQQNDTASDTHSEQEITNVFNEVFDLTKTSNTTDEATHSVLLVHPDNLPPAVIKSAQLYDAWEWTYCHTPKFVHNISVPTMLFNFGTNDINLEFHVLNGYLQDVQIAADTHGSEDQGVPKLEDIDEGLAELQQYVKKSKVIYKVDKVCRFLKVQAVRECVEQAICV